MDPGRMTIRELFLELTQIEDTRRDAALDGGLTAAQVEDLRRRQELVCSELRARQSATERD